MFERYKTKKESRERIHNVCKAILKEIEDHRDAFTNRKQPEHFVKVGDIQYVSRVLNINAYESVIHSGLYTDLKPCTQNSLSNLYNHIIYRNEMIDYVKRYRDIFFLYDNYENRNNLWFTRIKNYAIEFKDLEVIINDFMNRTEVLLNIELH